MCLENLINLTVQEKKECVSLLRLGKGAVGFLYNRTNRNAFPNAVSIQNTVQQNIQSYS